MHHISYSYTQKLAQTYRRLAGFAQLCDDAGRTSPRASRRTGPPRVPSRQASTVVEEANEKVRLKSRKGLRSAESTRISPPSTTRFWIRYIYLYGTLLCYRYYLFHWYITDSNNKSNVFFHLSLL